MRVLVFSLCFPGEIDRCLKKVSEGVEQFEDIWQKVKVAAFSLILSHLLIVPPHVSHLDNLELFTGSTEMAILLFHSFGAYCFFLIGAPV